MYTPNITIEIYERITNGVFTGREEIAVVCNITAPTSGLDISDFKIPDGLSAVNVVYEYSNWIDDSQFLKSILF